MLQAKRKGFTLVELMIVIAIIGILAATLLPNLIGGQARTRDAGRKSSLQATAAVFETFFADYGQYPSLGLDKETSIGSSGDSVACLGNSGAYATGHIAKMVKNKQFPVDPVRTSSVELCSAKGIFGYSPLVKAGAANSAYVLVSQVEMYANANSNTGSHITQTALSGSTYEALTDPSGSGHLVTASNVATGGTSADNRVYLLVSGG